MGGIPRFSLSKRTGENVLDIAADTLCRLFLRRDIVVEFTDQQVDRYPQWRGRCAAHALLPLEKGRASVTLDTGWKSADRFQKLRNLTPARTSRLRPSSTL